MNEMIGRCHDCTAPQTEVNMLSRHILELQKDKGELIDKVRELEAQIEKMKCCGNCVWSDCESKHPPCKCCDFNNKWELRR